MWLQGRIWKVASGEVGSCQRGSEPKRDPQTSHPPPILACLVWELRPTPSRRERTGPSRFADQRESRACVGSLSMCGAVAVARKWPWVARSLGAAAGWNTFCGEGKVALSFEQWDRLGDWPDRQWRVTAGCTNTMCTRYILQRQREWHPSP